MHVAAPLIFKVLAWLIALAWLWKAITSAIGLRRVPDLTAPAHNRTPPNHPSITAIIPACNEEKNIGACLSSLLQQDYANLHLIAIDDRSTDNTGAILNALATQHPAKLTALHITELPTGWLGKTHAMAYAARHAISLHHPDYLLFTDADILFRPETLRLALAQSVATQADHFVLLPTTLIKSPGEGMLLSYLQVMSLWAVRTWRISDPKALRDAVGVGAFNLVRTPVYQQLGGFEALRMEIVEDLALGTRIKRQGFRQRIATGPGLVSVHWASGVSGILNGMTKNFFAIFRYNPALALLACLWTTFFCIAPAVFLALPQTRTPAILTLLSVALLYVLSSRQSKVSPWYAVFFPISAALIVCAMLHSMLTTLKQGGVTWRGTFYPLSELRKKTHLTSPQS
ncbi:glycosyltransferase family 2 protein [Tunturibacter empetritectus]|uniref:Glycosyltransferase involved in cell wall biosynthesis n=1 Tax=Tunturiibacter lichenicola TaxID=2051959 RepID=A0A7W8JB90_9BACT|nr:glycosyltransferase [Edaphobacter lichenicola]MBB5345985.1 glycosyltransferase involved in cell wall biosynthesis [Edaphobacter lichenicola]